MRRPVIYLIGMPAAGKSAIGARLAVALGLPFVDLDREIEARAAASIPELFAREGEAAFRVREREALSRLSGLAQVVALGGGTPLDSANRALIKETGRVAWLRLASHELADRISREPGARPLLAEVARSPAALLGHLDQLLEARSPAYDLCAEFAFQVGGGKTVEELAVALASEICLRGWVVERRKEGRR